MIWVLVVFVVVVLTVAALTRPPRDAEPDPLIETRTQVELHRARRRLEVGQLKNEVKRDAARASRELRDELRAHGFGGREQS